MHPIRHDDRCDGRILLPGDLLEDFRDGDVCVGRERQDVPLAACSSLLFALWSVSELPLSNGNQADPLF